MAKYTVTNDQDPQLKAARKIVRGVWQENYRKSNIEGNEIRSYNQTQRLLSSPQGYDWLHEVLFDTLKNKQDPDMSNADKVYANKFFEGLYTKLCDENITYEDLQKYIASDESDDKKTPTFK